jgi:omega-amidase
VNKLRVALVQTELAWESPEANRRHFERILGRLEPTDLIVLPEMFSTGFSMQSQALAETMAGPTMAWLKATAANHSASVCGSVIIEEDQSYFNRFVLVRPTGEVIHYDKRHLFRMGAEHAHYTAGTDRLTIPVAGFTVFPQVCYDLRFPVFARNNLDYDLMIYVANWPATRRQHWQTLLRARAIENQCYVIGVNRIGVDGNDVAYAGDSAAIDFNGTVIREAGDTDTVIRAELDRDALLAFRTAFPAWRDADSFNLSSESSQAESDREHRD